MVPARGSEGATIGKTIFLCVYIEKNLLLQNQQANFNKLNFACVYVQNISQYDSGGDRVKAELLLSLCDVTMHQLTRRFVCYRSRSHPLLQWRLQLQQQHLRAASCDVLNNTLHVIK